MTYLHIQPELMISHKSLTFGLNFHWINYYSYDLALTREWRLGHHVHKDAHIKSRDLYLGVIRVRLYRTFDGRR